MLSERHAQRDVDEKALALGELVCRATVGVGQSQAEAERGRAPVQIDLQLDTQEQLGELLEARYKLTFDLRVRAQELTLQSLERVARIVPSRALVVLAPQQLVNLALHTARGIV